MKSLKSKALMALFLFVVSLVLSCWLGCGVVFAEKVGLKIQEVDGSPAVWATNLTLPNGTVSCTGSTCTYTPAGGSGDVTGVGDCASGACLDGSSDGGTYISLYDGTSSFMKMLAGVRTLTLSSGVANSEDLTITLGSNDNTVVVSSSTGVTTVDFGSIGLKAGTLVVGPTNPATLTPDGASGFSVAGQIGASAFSITKSSGVAGDISLYEANSTDTHGAGFRGPDSLTYSWRWKLPNERALHPDQVFIGTNEGETGTGGETDGYIQAGYWTYRGAALTPVIDDPDNFAANFTGANLYGGTFICNADGTAGLPDPAPGMNFTIVNEGANAVVINPNSTGTADTIVMNGLAVAQDENITSSTSGAMCVFQYRAANSWMATCNGFVEATPP